MVLLMFGNIGWSITDECSLYFLLSKHFFSKHCSFTKIFKQVSFFYEFLVNLLPSEKRSRNPVKLNVYYINGVWPTYLFVAGPIILLQCLSMIDKTGTNLSNKEIRRLLLLEQIPTLVNWMTKTLGRFNEKEISLPDICCRNVQFETKLLNVTHTWGRSVFATFLKKEIRQKTSITQYELWKNVYWISRSLSQQMPAGFTHI